MKLFRLKYTWPFCAFPKSIVLVRDTGIIFGIQSFFEILWQPFGILISNISRIITYIPLLWKDRDWDHGYFLDMLAFKLSRIEKALESGVAVHHPHVMRDLRTMIALLDRIREDNYNEVVFKDHNAKWGELKFTFGEKQVTKDGYFTTSCVSRPNIKSKEDEVTERSEAQRLYKKEIALKQRDLDLLFKLLRKRIESMWD